MSFLTNEQERNQIRLYYEDCGLIEELHMKQKTSWVSLPFFSLPVG